MKKLLIGVGLLLEFDLFPGRLMMFLILGGNDNFSGLSVIINGCVTVDFILKNVFLIEIHSSDKLNFIGPKHGIEQICVFKIAVHRRVRSLKVLIIVLFILRKFYKLKPFHVIN